jgi:hypothetical protein
MYHVIVLEMNLSTFFPDNHSARNGLHYRFFLSNKNKTILEQNKFLYLLKENIDFWYSKCSRLDWSYHKETNPLDPQRRRHWIGTLRGLEGAAVQKRPGRRRSRKKPWKWARLKELLLTESGGSVSQMPYAPEEATGIRYIKMFEM